MTRRETYRRKMSINPNLVSDPPPSLIPSSHKTQSITMTSKVSNSFSIKSVSQAIRNNRLAPKLKSAAGQPFLKKLFKTSCSYCSIKSESTAITKEEFRVRFSQKIHVQKTLPRTDYTPEEVEACWYNDEGNQRIYRHCNEEIRKMNEGCTVDEDKKYLSRGLEGHTTVGAINKKRNISLAINAVLDEQLNQWEEGIFDENAIAEVYRKASSSCQLWANIVGRRDHRETKAYPRRSRVASRAA
jgi:hypothetical protein